MECGRYHGCYSAASSWRVEKVNVNSVAIVSCWLGKSQPENQELAKSVSTNISAEVSNLIVERVEKRKKAGFEAFKIGRNVLRLVAATTWDQQLTLIEHFGGMMTPDQISSLINVEGAIKHAIHQAMLVEKVRKVIEVYQERMGEPFITLYHMTLQLDKDFYEWKKSLVAAEARQIKVELDAEREQSGA